jgi:hypothetical protein
VLGAGPVGLVAALQCSKHHRTTVIARRFPSGDELTTIEAVPASLLALLVEFGIHPRQVGVEQLHRSRVSAWESEAPLQTRGIAEAHVERPALDVALLREVVACGRVRIIRGDHASIEAAMRAARDGEVRLIDATGRRAVTARKKIHPDRPWASRTFLAPRRSGAADGGLRIAALPEGFVYRLGASNHLLMGVVGGKQTTVGPPSVLERRIHECGAGWILEGLPPIAELAPGRISAASVQWTMGEAATTIGDAALARDALSSQGLAAGMSEGLYVAAAEGPHDDTLLSLRKQEQRLAHLRAMQDVIARCRFRHHDAWRDYGSFLAEHASGDQVPTRVALRASRVLRV